MAVHNISIVGTSFVRRLKDDIRARTDPAFDRDFGLSDAKVRYVCKGGWYLQDVEENIEAIVDQNPEIVVLQCGSNDLCYTENPELLAIKILETAEEIRKQTQAKLVMVCQILNRRLGRYMRTQQLVDDYNLKAKKANSFLKVLADEYDGVKYWKHHGMTVIVPDAFYYDYVGIIRPDGVHVNDRGQFKYYKSMQGAIIQGIRRL